MTYAAANGTNPGNVTFSLVNANLECETLQIREILTTQVTKVKWRTKKTPAGNWDTRLITVGDNWLNHPN